MDRDFCPLSMCHGSGQVCNKLCRLYYEGHCLLCDLIKIKVENSDRDNYSAKK